MNNNYEYSKLNTYNLSFPIILLGGDNTISFARNSDELLICSNVAFKNGFYNGLKIIDSKGLYYTITKAEKLKNEGPLVGFNLFINKKIRVELFTANEYNSHSSALNLDDTKKVITDLLKANRGFWDSDGNLDKQLVFVKNASSHYEILNKLSNNYFNEFK